MKELEEPCKSAIREGRCLGCVRLEDPNFVGNKYCNSYDRRYKWIKRK